MVPGAFAICRLAAKDLLPSSFFSVTRSAEELSLVCLEVDIPEGAQVNGGWRCFRVAGTLDFNLTGILASLTAPLAAERVSVFAVSTFDTDYVLVKEIEKARAILERAGHKFS